MAKSFSFSPALTIYCHGSDAFFFFFSAHKNITYFLFYIKDIVIETDRSSTLSNQH